MAINKQLKELVLVFELNNTQNSYARCLSAIKYIENNIINSKGDVNRFYSDIRKIKEDFLFSVNQRSNGPNDKMEHPLNPNQYARIPVSPNEEEELLKYAIDCWRNEKEKLKRPLYHIRVKFNYDSNASSYQNIDNLQFLAMFMQQVYITCFFDKEEDFVPGKLTPDELKKRLSVFLVPHTGNSFKFGGEDDKPDTALYSIASQYLRLIAKMHNGVIYGHSPPGKIEAIEFKERTRNNMWFPLLYLADTESYGNYHSIFETSGMADESTIRNGFTWQTNDSKPFNKAGDDNPHIAIPDLIMDETRERLLTFFALISKTGLNEKISRAEILKLGRKRIAEAINIAEKETNFLDKIVKIASNCDRFTFTLFGYLLYANKDASDDSIMKAVYTTMELARELGDSVRHIVQNAIQHSQHHICYISFFKVKNVHPSDEIEEQLCIRITDLNTQKTVTQTFIQTLKDENKYDTFSNKGINISVRQLIGEFSSDSQNNSESVNKTLSVWYDFRKIDSAAHIGLMMFYNILKRCQCRVLQIISNDKVTQQDDKNNPDSFDYFAHNAGSVFNKSNYIIPGTQISFSIPITTLINSSPVNLVQLENNGVFCENYEAFAHYLDYKVLELDLVKKMPQLNDASDSIFSLNITNAGSKLIAQGKWKQFWNELMESLSDVPKGIHFCDIGSAYLLENFLKNRENCEVFIKGFFAAASTYRIEQEPKEYGPLCFKFENLPAHFINILQEVSIPLSLMDFSQNLQIFFSCKEANSTKYDKHQPKQLVILGNSVGHAIQNAYIMSLEHGEQSIETFYYFRVSEMLLPYKDAFAPAVTQSVCPFTVFNQLDTYDIPQYFKQIKEIAERPLVNEDISDRGYKFPHIHMRLGNKVHANSFYEMSFLFYRTSVANRVAFYILQKIIGIISCEENENIVFYGYASYSQAIIVSLQKMLEKYFEKNHIKKKVHYATYQFNLQAESDYYGVAEKPKDKMQIYSTFQGYEDNQLPQHDKKQLPRTSVVQIVPIGSTLTTFDKMRAKYYKDRKDFEDSKIIANYNVFLVRHNEEDTLSNIEKELWDCIDTDKREVTVNKLKLHWLDKTKISYIIPAKSEWSHPIECEQCFPINVQDEVPLIETDPTSTVPALQIYQKKAFSPTETAENNSAYSTNNKIIRLIYLQDCVFYGHFIRGRNHYQYYIDTQRYISKDKIDSQLKDWLIEERRKEDVRIRNKAKTTPVLNIIFTPEHNTNVGFSQKVNDYFFNGTAEIVSVNVDKQFRSNFVCEHDALRQTIERLFNENLDNEDTNNKNPNDESPVHFFFVDDSIISGGSYRRADALLKSLIPESQRVKYHGSVFSKCFVLINRLSFATQESYIANPGNNFLSFCNINISNMRKQGDSCVGCKLEREAKHLFKRSSTRSFTNYWIKKAGAHTPIMFDDVDKIKEYGSEKAFVRMILTHVVVTLIEKYKYDKNSSEKVVQQLFYLILGESFKPLDCDRKDDGTIIDIKDDEETALVKIAFQALSEAKEENKYKYPTEEDKTINLVEHTVKILSRPFLSYYFDLKPYVLGFVINVCESILVNGSQEEIAKKIKDVLVKVDPKGIKLLGFIKNCLFEALADMKSTYILRKETIRKIYLFTMKYTDLKSENNGCPNYGRNSCQCIALVDQPDENKNDKNKKNYPCGNSQIRCFWKMYAFYIHYVIDGGGDETRSLWMEYLFISGDEYSGNPESKERIKKGVSLPLLESILSGIELSKEAKQLFEEFLREIFLQNSRLLYDGIEKHCEKSGEKELGIKSTDTPEIDLTDNSYFLQNLKIMRSWNLDWASVDTKPENATNIEIVSDKDALKDMPGVTKEEKEMFNFLAPNEDGLVDTDKKYEKFIGLITDMMEAKYRIEPNRITQKGIRIALITQKGVDESYDMNDFDFITDNIPKDDQTAKARYIIKQRIIWALGNEIYGNTRLIEDGYYLMLPTDDKKQDDDFDFEKDSNFYRKPFFILRFDNIQVKRGLKLDREAQPIEKVFLYISFSFDSSEADKEKASALLIMRDILSYRNRIMRMLEKDFNSHLMQIHAHKAGENAILKHEKTVSHLSTFDDRFIMKLWTKEPLKNDDYEWLLFRSYINTQIAKLFRRTLLLIDEESINRPPKLYLQNIVQNKYADRKSIGTLPAETFKDLWDKSDRRLELCRQIIDFEIEEGLDAARLITPIHNQVRGYFNREYLKCILFDIFLTCAKFWNEDKDFLARIKTLKGYLKEYNEKIKEIASDGANTSSLDSYDRQRSKIWLIRNGNNLVVINPIKITHNNILDENGWKEQNRQIKFQLTNPYDSFDGHMSLFTICNYIKNNYKNEYKTYINNILMFEYRKFKDLEPDWKDCIKKKWSILSNDESLWFVSKLPIFNKEA